MMESCLNYKPERVTAITVEDLKKDLLDDFSNISTLSQESLSDKEHLQVYLRVRPFTNAEQEAGESQQCVEVEGPDTVVLKAPRTSLSARLSEKPVQTAQRFRFSQVYGPDTTQQQMFDGTAKGLVKDVLEGGNSLIFTYGVTNAGKTFTFLGPEADGGIVPRSLRVIFHSIEGRIYTQNNIKPHRCMDFTRLTKDQQDEEFTSKKNLLRRLKETDVQKSLTCKTFLEGSTSSDIDMQGEEECFSLEGDSNTKYSVWVSFCEIYNETIHDLLEVLPNGPVRRTTLRLSQDVKGNTFVKDLKWIQVNNAEEAYRVLKIGRKNQSFSSTKLNNVSSRSHSIFSIRILRIEDIGVPRVLTISELSLCDLAGSERCAKTQNKGDRLKEAGNINTSLLTLGKCITALRLNQTQPKYQPHIPFRESKLTHYLQGFFCGRGKACMIVNINQCASMYDETLNVLKFSAVAQKVVVLTTRPAVPKREKSGREVSFIINDADRRHLWAKRRSTLMAWETTLEDVQEDEDDEEEMEDEEEEEEEEDDSADETVAEGTVLEAGDEDVCEAQRAEIQQLKANLTQQQEENLALESRIREEVTSEFMELFSKMESDYNERLQKEKEIIEERAERRLEILKDLVKKNANEFAAASTEDATKEEFMDSLIEAMRSDLAKIKRDAAEVQTCLVTAESPAATAGLRKQVDELAEELLTSQQLLGLKTSELESVKAQAERTNEKLQAVQESYEGQTLKVQELMGMCHEKDAMIAKLQETLDHSIETTTNDRSLINAIREEILHFKQNCRCSPAEGGADACDRNKDARWGPDSTPRGVDCQAADDSEKLRAEVERLLAEAEAKDERLDELGRKLFSLEQSVQEQTAALADEAQLHEAALASLDRERLEMASLEAERNALAEERERLRVETDELTSKVVAAETEARLRAEEAKTAEEEVAKLGRELQAARAQAKEHEEEAMKKSKAAAALEQEVKRLKEKAKLDASKAKDEVARLREELQVVRAQAKEHEEEALEKSKAAAALEQEVKRLKEKAKLDASKSQGGGQTFSEALHGLKEECENLARTSLTKNERIKELERELEEAHSQLQQMEEVCGELEQLCDQQQGEAGTRQAQLDIALLDLEDGTKRHAELQKEAQGLREQLAHVEEERLGAAREAGERVAELERQLQEAETLRHGLEEKLKGLQSQNGDEQSQQDRSGVATAELEEALAQQKANMETVTRELSDRKEQVKENLKVIKSLGQDLKLKDRDISWLRERLRDRESEIEQLLYKISRINDENSTLQRRLSDTERIKNETLSDLRLKDQTILQLKTDQPSYVQLAESPHQSPKVDRDLPAKERFIQDLRSALSEQRVPAEQEQLLEAKLREIESLTSELMNLKERCPQEGPSPSSRVGSGELSDMRPDETSRVPYEKGESTLEEAPGRGSALSTDPSRGEEGQQNPLQDPQQEKLLTDVCIPATPVSVAEEEGSRSEEKHEGTAATTPKSESENTKEISTGLHSRLAEPLGDTTSLTQEASVLDSSEGIWGSSVARRLHNQSDLDISFTPPTERINRWVQWDSEERPKPSPKQNRPRRTSRKRRKPAEGQVQSENRSEEDQTKKTTPLKRLSQMNHQESPTVLGKAASEIRQQGSPACQKNKGPHGRGFQTGGHSTQPSSAVLRSKVKSTSSSKSPEPPSATQAGRPRRTKRKLYKADTSTPLDLGSPPVVVADRDDKESDHLIIKRKLRTRTAKI
ncbi:uncharacterized protein kif20bb isoform X2 [Alosa pseudoharengus]|uniref:uncharacterized protein kif20bb isoform X2 n=1 Tax=Alosa pseudoharengus TaxID=34774 RepID=UPI003F8945BF